ncbi:antitoxin YezG family protein [Nocardioides sp. NBC_00368]|uniref:immunity protein YezG family protein n=1 Tax=Nocardioides sp. NBC_00368 TaxID=2976000 RepID=UPI002E1F59E5
MLVENQSQLEKLGHALMGAVNGDWSEIVLEVSAAGALTDTGLHVVRPDGIEDWSVKPTVEVFDASKALRRGMYQPDKGTWYSATARLDRDGQLDVDFDYDNPPLDGDAEDELLLKDQVLFPRDAGHLPDWHPAHE